MGLMDVHLATMSTRVPKFETLGNYAWNGYGLKFPKLPKYKYGRSLIYNGRKDNHRFKTV